MRTALYSVIHAGTLPFVAAWYRSVQAQTDRAFDLWLSLDGVSPQGVQRAAAAKVDATWRLAEVGATPASLRSRALSDIVGRYDAVVFVDSDDLLHPERVAAAKAGLACSDLYGCAMQFIDVSGRPLAGLFEPAPSEAERWGDGVLWEALLPYRNVFGMSNTAYRASTLARVLPLPVDTALVDWFVATCAWLDGARLTFDPYPYVAYRQHRANTARVIPPYTAAYLAKATDYVLTHHRAVLDAAPPCAARARTEARCESVRRFAAATARPETSARYLAALNRAKPVFTWWEVVAYPPLEAIWTRSA